MDYRVLPGLYALGEPDRSAPVLVTANYKMSFDRLRSSLPGRHAWILVLETFGINVWCAAGHGSFGTEELVARLRRVGLDRVVDHRLLILPQLGAPGVAGHRVEEATGFAVVWGPIRAEDLPAFLDANNQATPEMRRKTFALGERAVLVPVELTGSVLPLAIILPLVLLLGGLLGGEGFWPGVVGHGLLGVVAVLGGLLAGAVLTPLLLPWLPGRAFTVKGLLPGLAVAAVLWLAGFALWGKDLSAGADRLELAAWSLVLLAITAFLAMNFTGASTYTSLSGVKLEVRRALPLQIITVLVGLGLWISSRWMA
jgi:acetyl-CoA decarbonylase/synthase complex subunit gamma